MRAPWKAFVGMGMRPVWILILTDLFPSILCLAVCTPLSVLLGPLLPLPLPLGPLALGCPWSQRYLGLPMVGLLIIHHRWTRLAG